MSANKHTPGQLNYDPTDPDKMRLPAGTTCGDCAHIRRCKAIFGHVETDTYCDWSPSRFRAPATTRAAMSALDLPGPGDRATWAHHAADPRSPDFEGDDDAPDTTETNLEALREWLETFQAAARLRDRRRMEQARLFAVSLMDSLIEVAR